MDSSGAPKRSLARSSGSRSSSATRAVKRPTSPTLSSSSRHSTSASSSRSATRSSTSKPPTAAKPQTTTHQESHQPQQTHQTPATGAPPPAYPYANAAAGGAQQQHPSYAAAAGSQATPMHAQGQGMQPYHPQGAAAAQPAVAAAAPPAAAAAAAGGGGGPSFMKTAASSAVGAVVGSMAGTALANSLTHRDNNNNNNNENKDSTSVQGETTSTTTSGPTVTIAPDAAAMTALTQRSNVNLTFTGLDEETFKTNFTDAEAFGTTVRDAVVRALGVSADRVVLEDVSVTTSKNKKKGSTAVVQLTLLPHSGLLSSEPSSHELAEEIRRQLQQNNSFLARELRVAAPQLPTALVETISSKIMRTEGEAEGKTEAKASAANAGTLMPIGAGFTVCTTTAAVAALMLLFA
ncbi:hypothetical protein Emed_005127 [Eimeria media]